MELELIRAIADFQFGRGVGEKLFPDSVKILKGKTGRIRWIYLNNTLLATIEPTTGFLILTYEGGLRLKEILEYPKYRIVISDEAVPFVSKGKSVFCKFVIDLDEEILPKDIVLIVDKKDNLIAVGEAKLSALEIKQFKKGVAAVVKHIKKKKT